MKKLLLILMLGMFLIVVSGITYATITANRSIELPKELVDFSKTTNSNFNYSIQKYGKESMVCLYKIIGTGKDAKQENIKCKRVENKLIDEKVKKLIKKFKSSSGKTKEELEKMLIEEKLKNRMLKDNLINLRIAINKFLNEEIKKL